MQKIKTILLAAILTLISVPTFAAQTVGNDAYGYVVVQHGKGPGMAGEFYSPTGYRFLRLYNNTNNWINCQAKNLQGQWLQTGPMQSNSFRDLAIGNIAGYWQCWYQ